MRPPSPAALRRSLLACGLIVVLALLAGCGSGDDTAASSGGGNDKQGGASSAAVDSAPSQTKTPASTPCRAQLGDFLGSLTSLRTRLAAGLSYQQYARAVKSTRAAYDRLPVDRLPPACLVAAGSAAEKAFNRYITAANTWGQCLADAGCNAEVVEPELQHEWQVASHWLSEAQAGLRG